MYMLGVCRKVTPYVNLMKLGTVGPVGYAIALTAVGPHRLTSFGVSRHPSWVPSIDKAHRAYYSCSRYRRNAWFVVSCFTYHWMAEGSILEYQWFLVIEREYAIELYIQCLEAARNLQATLPHWPILQHGMTSYNLLVVVGHYCFGRQVSVCRSVVLSVGRSVCPDLVRQQPHTMYVPKQCRPWHVARWQCWPTYRLLCSVHLWPQLLHHQDDARFYYGYVCQPQHCLWPDCLYFSTGDPKIKFFWKKSLWQKDVFGVF